MSASESKGGRRGEKINPERTLHTHWECLKAYYLCATAGLDCCCPNSNTLQKAARTLSSYQIFTQRPSGSLESPGGSIWRKGRENDPIGQRPRAAEVVTNKVVNI